MIPLPMFLEVLTKPLVQNWMAMQPRERREKFFSWLWTAFVVHLAIGFSVFMVHWMMTAPDCSTVKTKDAACIER